MGSRTSLFSSISPPLLSSSSHSSMMKKKTDKKTKQIDDDVNDPYRAEEDGLPNRHSFLSLSSSPSEPSITGDDKKKFSMRRPLLRTCSFLLLLLVVATTATFVFVTKQGAGANLMSRPSFSFVDHRAEQQQQQYQTPLGNDTTNRPIFPGKTPDSHEEEEEENDHHMIDDDQHIDGSDQHSVVLVGQLSHDQDNENHGDYIHHDEERLNKIDDSYDEKRQIDAAEYDHDDESTSSSSSSFLTVFKNNMINDQHDVDDKRHMQHLSSSSSTSRLRRKILNNPQSSTVASGVYFIKSSHWGTYLRMRDDGDVDLSATASDWEMIHIQKHGNNIYSLKSLSHGNMYVRVGGPGKHQLVNTQKYVGSYEKFYIDSVDNTRVAFRSAAHYNYLRSGWGGAEVDTQTYIGKWEQFVLVPVVVEVAIVSDLDGLCLAVPSYASNGVDLILWNCHQGNNQKWQLNHDGSISSSLDNNKCIEVQGSVYSSGTPIEVQDCNSGNPAQQWDFLSDGTIQSLGNPSYCIDGNGFDNVVYLWTCGGSSDQYWTKLDAGMRLNSSTI